MMITFVFQYRPVDVLLLTEAAATPIPTQSPLPKFPTPFTDLIFIWSCSCLPGPTLFSIIIVLVLPSGHIRSLHDVVVEFPVVSLGPLVSLTHKNCTLY